MVGWLQAGYFVRIWDELSKEWDYAYLSEEEIMPKYIFGQTAVDGYQFGGIAAGSQSDYQSIKDLNMGRNHLGQFLMGCRTNCLFYLQHPAAREIGGLDERPRQTSDFREVAFYDQHESPFDAPSWKAEIFTMKDIYPAVNAYNPTNRKLYPEISFVGRLFVIEPVEKDEDIYKKLVKREIPSRPIKLGGISNKGKGI